MQDGDRHHTVQQGQHHCLVLYVGLLAVVYLVLAGCSALRVVPIQMTRIAQMESYRQIFILTPSDADTSDVTELHRLQDARMEDIFDKLLGRENWQALKDLYGVASMREELVERKVALHGTISFNIYLDPIDHNLFYIDGVGRYFLVREVSGEILLAGDFQVLPKQYRRSDLDRGYLVTNIKIYVDHVPGQITRVNDAPLKYKIYIDTSRAARGVYAIDYRKAHGVYISTAQDEDLRASDMIGLMYLDQRGARAKLLDFRGLQYVRSDYMP